MSTLRVDTITDGTNSVSSDTVIKGSSKSWINFNGVGVVAVRGSFNTSTIVDGGVGDYTQNFTSSVADVNYSVPMTSGAQTNAAGYSNVITIPLNLATSALRVLTPYPPNGVVYDQPHVSVTVFR